MANIGKISGPPRADGSRAFKWRAATKDANGKRISKVFDRKGDAEAWIREVSTAGVVGSSSVTIMAAAEAHYRHFDKLVRQGAKEAVTRDGYATAIERHLRPDKAFAALRMNELTAPKAQAYLDAIFERTGSLDLARRQRRYLITWCDFAIRKGWLGVNPIRATKIESVKRHDDEEAVEIPDKGTLGVLLRAAGQGDHPERDTAIVRLLMFGGLRISELLGLADDNASLGKDGGELKITERLCRQYEQLGPPKSAKARRKVPVGPAAGLAVKAWRVRRGASPTFMHEGRDRSRVRKTGRLFPGPTGGVWGYNDFARQCWLPLMRRAELVEMLPDAKGKNRPVQAFGPHTLRHAAVSLWIEQGLSPKRVQELAGHASLTMTMDLYGHLWADSEGDAALARKSEAIIG